MSVLRKAMATTLLFAMLFDPSLADLERHSIDGEFYAVFPSEPRFEGQFENGDKIVRSYNYTDEENRIVYTGTYSVKATYFEDVVSTLNYYVKGQANSVGGNVESIKVTNMKGNESAVFLIVYTYQGVAVRKFGVVSYKMGRFYQWAIQDIPSMSKLNAQTIFEQYLPQFGVR